MQRLLGAIFQQDNARPHTAKVSQNCLRTVTTLPSPAQSADLSPIEYIWDNLGRRFGHLTSLNELEARLQQMWNEMSQDIIQNICQVIYSQFGLAIHQNDHQTRRRFVEWAQNEIAVVPDFHKRILFSDEAHFWLNGYVNKQNCRIWSEANPQVYVETPLHPEKLTELWFQQDGATCHTARATIDLLKHTFGDRLISRFGPVNWPPRSCDLTPLDYFLWGYVKSLVYADKPQTLDHLEDNIRRVIADIRPQMLEKVIENWTSRLDYIRASRGSPIPEIIFKMGTLNNRRAASPLVRLVAEDERWEAPGPPTGCSPSKLEWNRAKSYCHLYGAQGYDRGPRFDYVRQVALATTTI
ncbi:histone-lysine N-methyltransferase SETMAR [Trichonephila clavipes]|nr:histone-lysine N-methyltransferase SETMAR [Trichonephila clavipes]